jgi:hypothetical protein
MDPSTKLRGRFGSQHAWNTGKYRPVWLSCGTVQAAAAAAPWSPLHAACALAKSLKWLPWVTLSKHPPSGDQYAQFTELPSWNVATALNEGGLAEASDEAGLLAAKALELLLLLLLVAAQDWALALAGSLRRSKMRTVRSSEAAAK